MKVGIIRCMQTEDYCPGTTDFKAIREKTGVFEGVEEEIELIGFINCGGCPGKKVSLRIRELIRRGADTIAFASSHRLSLPFRKTNERSGRKRNKRGNTDTGSYTLKSKRLEVLQSFAVFPGFLLDFSEQFVCYDDNNFFIFSNELSFL